MRTLILRAAALAAAVAVGAAVRAHMRDMRTLRETDALGAGFRAAREREQRRVLAIGTPADPTRLLTLAELRQQRGEQLPIGRHWPARWRPDELLAEELAQHDREVQRTARLSWWERTWPEPERLEDDDDDRRDGGDAA